MVDLHKCVKWVQCWRLERLAAWSQSGSKFDPAHLLDQPGVFFGRKNGLAKWPVLLFVSSVRSSSGYHGLIEIQQQQQQGHFSKLFQILQILK